MNKEDQEFLDKEEQHNYKDDDIIERADKVVEEEEEEESDLDDDMYNIDGENSDNDEQESSSSEDEKLKQKQKYKTTKTSTAATPINKNKRNLTKSLSNGEFKIIPYSKLKDNTPTKGILKNKSEQPPPKKNRIVWDEENLTINDMNKSSTMKIDEPKTPFHYYESEEESDESKKYLENKFLELQNALDKQQEKSEWDSDEEDNNKKNKKKGLKIQMADDSDEDEEDEEEEDEEKKESRKKFDKLRKAHYNEFQLAKKLDTSYSDDDDDDDDE